MHRRVLLGLISASVTSSAFGQCEVGDHHGSMTEFDDLFGGSVALSGDVAAIVESGYASSLGALFVFRLDESTWTEEGFFMAPDPVPEDGFGRVAIDGNVILLGAPLTSTIAPGQGAVHVYRYDPGVQAWGYETTLTPGSRERGLHFGFSVAIDGDTALVGSVAEEAAYVFRYNGTEWIQAQRITNPEVEEEDAFGLSVAIRGDIALVGDAGNGDLGPQAGAAFIFRQDGDTWIFESQLLPSDPQIAGWFGFVVATNGEVLAITAPNVDSQNGAVYVFRHNGDAWVEEQKLVASNPVGPFPLLGDQVAVSDDGTAILTGAPDDQELGFSAGAVHLFRYEKGVWSEAAKITASDGQSGAAFGSALALDGDRALVGAGNHGGFGKVYEYLGILGTDCNSNGGSDACDIFNGTSHDSDGSGVPDECELPGNVNGDTTVDIEDLIAVILGWGPCPKEPQECPADLNGNGVVERGDIAIVISNWS